MYRGFIYTFYNCSRIIENFGSGSKYYDRSVYLHYFVMLFHVLFLLKQQQFQVPRALLLRLIRLNPQNRSRCIQCQFIDTWSNYITYWVVNGSQKQRAARASSNFFATTELILIIDKKIRIYFYYSLEINI